MLKKNWFFILIFIVIAIGAVVIIRQSGGVGSESASEQKQDQNQKEQPDLFEEFTGEKGETVILANGGITLAADIFDDNLAHYYNTELNNKTIYFFVVKDKQGIYRTAVNACQVCFESKMGFRQEGDYIVCNTCGNKYPLEKIATEKGGCNPAPINPDLKVENGKIFIQMSELEQVSGFF